MDNFQSIYEATREKRDRCKQAKFNILFAGGSVPEPLKPEWDKLQGPGKGNAPTDFINSKVLRDEETGNLSIAVTAAPTVASEPTLSSLSSFPVEAKGASQDPLLQQASYYRPWVPETLSP